LAQAMESLPQRSVILDGEVAVFDRELRSRWDWLRRAPGNEVATPPVPVAFDVLLAGDADLRRLPLRERREVLKFALDGSDMILPGRRLAPDGLKAWRQVEEHAYEGLVAKNNSSPYVGGRTLHWLKVLRPEARAAVAKSRERTPRNGGRQAVAPSPTHGAETSMAPNRKSRPPDRPRVIGAR
jgi:ATP-dependent DNA ligase